MMAEHSPSMHGVMCRYLGFCRYAEHASDSDIQIIFLDVTTNSAPSVDANDDLQHA